MALLNNAVTAQCTQSNGTSLAHNASATRHKWMRQTDITQQAGTRLTPEGWKA